MRCVERSPGCRLICFSILYCVLMNDLRRYPVLFPPPFANAWGDDNFGLFADITISTLSAVVIQRLRWIEPGNFWMGSPENELERADREGPQHTVTLSQGFWLADTACTQGLWEAVMARNPSEFKGDDQLPVESVSWFDVQEFLGKLEALLPGCRAGLPTEAEWEYACRAGTQTPFSFGEGISPDEVNYYGEFPYAGGEKGLYRRKTVPVKSLPSNGWGLYQMHGNVWEWCEDELRSYDGEPQRDPVGQGGKSEEAPRAVRGGSWFNDARGARSAFRCAYQPGDANDYLGFRLCLRSIEPSVEKDRPGGTEG
jgi:formylglycine-generating enzyme required for sulfatase activity